MEKTKVKKKKKIESGGGKYLHKIWGDERKKKAYMERKKKIQINPN